MWAPRWRRAAGLVLLVLWVLPALWAGAGARWSGEGSSAQLQSIFLGRCADYTRLLGPEQRSKNCTAIWEAFKVVLEKEPCSVLPSDYDLFLNLSWHPLPRDKSLFWENNHLLVTSFADQTRRFTPLCDVLYGRVGDFLSWCRQRNASGLDYESCPTMEDCENNPVDSYWKRASMQYAQDSSGVIYVMLNGSEPRGAYPVKGFFADFEIPYLQQDKVTRIEVWVMHEIGRPRVPVKLLMCVDHSSHPDCALKSAAASSQRGVPSPYAEPGAGLIAPLFVAALASAAQF
ncbi:ADP-ribosyl cyclase/cyclic ADP-ribose hydrolase 2 isoform X2 [Erinaceus europaeus]|uniref:ADP-ribosyl cyclase/cyclic ADP-ribose hydrolase n=1 Tax=Erinaceus europaeus TaxID=9365 RepID=A0ABM3X644_ERIEU|nr:ADP-ribosyl cyclase/cyclic ADP-ribose hydrolase 2 isoform X2 [Erinaceus europaeus]